MSIAEKVLDLADDVMVRLITKGAEKQARVNTMLEEKGSDVRIGSFEVQMGKPPSVVYVIEKVTK